MNKIYIKLKYGILFALLSQLFLLSCEQLVEVEIPNNQISAELVFEDVQTANAALAGLYAGLFDDSPLSGGLRGSGALLGIYTDDLESFATSVVNSEYDLYKNQQIDDNSAVFSYWAAAYQKVYVANSILMGVEQSSAISSQDKLRLRGEALFVRSVLFFYLQQTFGDIPYPLTTNFETNRSIGRTPSAEVLNKLVSDLSESSQLLTDTYRETERIVPNRKVAELMLAKVYLLQNKYSDAEILLKGIINNSLYIFENDLSKVFAKSGKHILWQLKPKNAVDPTKEATLYYFINAAPSVYALSNDLMNSFSAGDLRKNQWTTAVTFNQNTRFRSSKYKNISNNSTEYSIVLRLEEVNLLLAETLAQQNKIAEAIPIVNKTRSRAGLSMLTSTLSKEDLLTEIALENRKEFFAEMGHRFFDLKRMSRLQILQPLKSNWKVYHQFWPIPQKELLLNKNLNPQNAGY